MLEKFCPYCGQPIENNCNCSILAEYEESTIKKLKNKTEKLWGVFRINVITEDEEYLGSLNKDEIDLIVKEYTFNGLFYEKKNGKYIIIVYELQQLK